MLGTVVNVAAIAVGSLLGCLLKRGLSEKLRSTVTHGLGLCVLLLGMKGALETKHELVLILSVVIGGGLGAWIDIEGRLDRLGTALQTRFSKDTENTFARGFVSSTLLFCVGAMAIIGSLNSGLRGDHTMLFAKSLLDGVSSIIFASMMGIGVILSSVAVLIYQGSITLLAQVISPILSTEVINEMSAAGGVLILGIGLNFIRKDHIPVGNLLPAVFVPVLLLVFM